CHQLKVVLLSLCHDALAKLYIRRANNEPLHFLRAQTVDGRRNFLSVWGTDFHYGKPFFLARLLGKLPFVLEPGLFRLLDHKSYLHRLGSQNMARQQYGRSHRGAAPGGPISFHVFAFVIFAVLLLQKVYLSAHVTGYSW